MYRTWVTGLVGLMVGGGVVGAAVAMQRSRDHGRGAPLSAEQERPAEDERLGREVGALRQEVAALRLARAAPVPVGAFPSPQASPAPPQRRSVDLADEWERSRAENEANVHTIASRLEAEPRDASWGRATEQRFSEAFRLAETPDVRLVSVDCRTTLCGATFQSNDARSRNGVAHVVAASLTDAADIVYSYSNDGTTTVAYISREGQRLGAP